MSSQTSKAIPARLFTYPFDLWNEAILRIATRIGGKKGKEVERFLKFATVGAIGAVIDFGVLNLLQASLLKPAGDNISLKVAVATGTAFTSAVCSNFVWNRYWTYPDSRSRSLRQQLTLFFIINLAGLVFRLIWVRVTFAPFGDIGVDVLDALGRGGALSDTAIKQLGTNIAQFWAVWIVMVWNFFVNRYWTYNDVE